MSVQVLVLRDRQHRQLNKRPVGNDIQAGPDHPLTISTPGEQAGCTKSQAGTTRVSAPLMKPLAVIRSTNKKSVRAPHQASSWL